MQQLQRLNEVGAERVLEGDQVGLHVARQLHDLFVLHVDAHDRTNAFREDEVLWLAEWCARLNLSVAPDDRWVQALLNDGPEAEDCCERIALNAQVAAVANMDGADLINGPLLGVRREDVGEAGIHPHADQRDLPLRLPEAVLRHLIGAEHLAWHRVRILLVWHREAGRHVDVVDARLECRVKDRWHKARINSVQHQVRLG